MSELSMWLYPLVASAVVAFIIYLRNGISWTWGGCLQQALIFAVATSGLVSGRYGISAEIGWALFFLFNVVQRSLIVRLNNDLAFLRPEAAMSKARLVRFLAWGPPGAFWMDMCLLVQKFSLGDVGAAEVILEKWRRSKLPKAGVEYLSSFEMLGRVIVRDWEAIVREFESHRQMSAGASGTETSVLSCQMASRAYGELGRFDQSVYCLEAANLPAARLTASALDTQFMTFFAMCGAVSELEEVLTRLASTRNALPEYARLFWLARCYASAGYYDRALDCFEQCRQKTPPSLSAWVERIARQVARVESLKASTETNEQAPGCLASPSVLARAGRILHRTRYVLELVRPEKTRPGVLILMALIVLVFTVTNSFYLFHVAGLEELYFPLRDFYILSYSFGVLDSGHVFAGQWWRLLTYQFLHANLSHLALNVFALLWFGKLVENMFGTRRFLIIYFLSGVLSGLGQILVSPHEVAVGASGAIMGIFGAAGAGMIRLKNVLPANIRKMELRWMGGLALAQIMLDQVINYFSASARHPDEMPHIAAYAHIGGMLVGFLAGLVLPLSKPPESLADNSASPSESG